LPEPGIFDEAALLYDEMRPKYPEELIKDVINLSGIPEKGSILEVGCGTGQATLPFASNGYQMTCLDIGENLIEVAKRKLRSYEVDFYVTSFEEWTPSKKYDLLISATAFHWINPAERYRLAYQVIKDDGWIALFWNKHPTPYTGFFAEVQKVYNDIVPEWRNPNESPTTEEWIHEHIQEIEESDLFGDVLVKKYPFTVKFTSKDYVKLLNTFSDHRSLEKKQQQRLYAGIEELIDNEYGGYVDRPYLSILFMSEKN